MKRLIKNILALCGLIVLSSWAATASGHSPHDSIAFLAVSPDYRNDSTLFIGVLKQVQVSTDGGYSWKRLYEGLTNRSFIRDMAISPEFAKDRTVFLSTAGDGVYRSVNGGDSWAHLPRPARSNVRRLRISQSYGSDSTLLAMPQDGGLFTSRNRGDAWSELLGADVEIADALATSVDGAHLVLAIMEDGSALRMFGASGEWEEVDGLSRASGGGVVWASTSATSILVVDGNGRVFASDDRATSFRPIGEIPAGLDGNRGPVTSISSSTASDGTVLIHASTWHGGVVTSRDGGKNWLPLNGGLTKSKQADELDTPHFSRIIPADDHLFLAGFDGLFRSDDRGQHWFQLETLAVDLPTALAVSRPAGKQEELFITTLDAGNYVGKNRGSDWQTLNLGIKNTHQWSIRSRELDGDSSLVLSAANKSIYRLVNHEMPWEQVLLGCRAAEVDRTRFEQWLDRKLVRYGLKQKCNSLFPHGIVLTDDFNAGGFAFIGTRYDGVFRSSDRGKSWQQILEGNGRWADTVAPVPGFANDNTIYASLRGRGIFESADGGEHWRRVPVPGLDDWLSRYIHARLPIALSPGYSSDGMIFVGSVNGLYRGLRRGADWQRITAQSGLPDGVPVVTLALSPSFPVDGYMLVSLQGRGLYASEDKGGNFFELAADLTSRNQKLLQIVFSENFASDQTVFAISEEEVLISGDRGHSWGKLDRHFLYEDRTNPVRFLGNWNKVTGVQFSAFSAMESDVLGDSATLRFKGGGVGLVAPGSPDQGIAEVYVDGRLVTTVDQFSEAPADEPTLHHITGLAPGIHTITVKVSGEKNDRATGTRIVIDAFRVEPVVSQ